MTTENRHSFFEPGNDPTGKKGRFRRACSFVGVSAGAAAGYVHLILGKSITAAGIPATAGAIFGFLAWNGYEVTRNH